MGIECVWSVLNRWRDRGAIIRVQYVDRENDNKRRVYIIMSVFDYYELWCVRWDMIYE